ncbi:MAG: hypothetical protein GTO63_35035 [Anaerolineae bacterium]|nr:hypothetical protein [Anaerolineae bacterium]NIN99909.1 hypothetical protein [Anaerolineae bacterium]NIQ79346.1 hypothetical protein [Anaerolineae bacterium]
MPSEQKPIEKLQKSVEEQPEKVGAPQLKSNTARMFIMRHAFEHSVEKQ